MCLRYHLFSIHYYNDLLFTVVSNVVFSQDWRGWHLLGETAEVYVPVVKYTML